MYFSAMTVTSPRTRLIAVRLQAVLIVSFSCMYFDSSYQQFSVRTFSQTLSVILVQPWTKTDTGAHTGVNTA